jgi:hypothetical protein
MKNLRTLCAACVFALAFAMPASAGYIAADMAPPPPPTPTTSVDGYIAIGFTSPDSVTETALTLIQMVLTLP